MIANSIRRYSQDQQLIEYFEQNIIVWQEIDVNKLKEKIIKMFPNICNKMTKIISSIFSFNQQQQLEQISEHDIEYKKDGYRLFEQHLNKQFNEKIIIQWKYYMDEIKNSLKIIDVQKKNKDDCNYLYKIKKKLYLRSQQQKYKKTKVDQDNNKTKIYKEFKDQQGMNIWKCIIHNDNYVVLQYKEIMNYFGQTKITEYQMDRKIVISIKKYLSNSQIKEKIIDILLKQKEQIQTEILSSNKKMLTKEIKIDENESVGQQITAIKLDGGSCNKICQINSFTDQKSNQTQVRQPEQLQIIQSVKDIFGQNQIQEINRIQNNTGFIRITYDDIGLQYNFIFEQIDKNKHFITQSIKYRNGDEIINLQENLYGEIITKIITFKDIYGNRRVQETKHGQPKDYNQFVNDAQDYDQACSTIDLQLLMLEKDFQKYYPTALSLFKLKQKLEQNNKSKILKQGIFPVIDFHDENIFQNIEIQLHNQYLKYKIDCQKKEFKKIFQRKLLELFQDN